MSLQQHLSEIKQRYSFYSTRNLPAERASEADRYAAEAYIFCKACFGEPKDAKQPHHVVQGNADFAFCWHCLGTYYLVMSKEVVSSESLCSQVAHEMFHRVTADRKGLAGEMWIQEMMACLTSYWFLRRQGFKEYAEAHRKGWLDAPGEIDVVLMRNSKRPSHRNYPYNGGDAYSATFLLTMFRVGYALNRIVDGNSLCRIISFPNLSEWIKSLPEGKQYGVSHILETPRQEVALPREPEDLAHLYNALETLGDEKRLVSALREVTASQPENGDAFFHLGRVHERSKELEAARDAYLKAKELGCSSRWLPYNLGNVYWNEKDYLPAAEWYWKAFEEGEQWAQARYWQGRALQKLGDLTGARAAWKQVLMLSDEEHLKKAQKALEDNPLPDTGTAPVN